MGQIILIFMVLLVLLGTRAIICVLLYSCYTRIPVQFREMEAGLVWLLLIPCLEVVWNFFVFPRLSRSLAKCFSSVGRTDVGDCGAGIGLSYAICSAVSVVPYLGCLTAIASLVLLILYFVKVIGLTRQLSVA